MATSADKRRERILILKSLGFTHQQAFRWNNARGEKIEAVIAQAKRDLESTPREERTDRDRERLRSFRNVAIKNNPRLLSRSEKRAQWSQWSSTGGSFPVKLRNRIRELNAGIGADPLDSFGYQAAYFEYVEEFDDVDDGDFYEEGTRK